MEITPELYHILDLIPASVYWKNLEGQYLGCNQYMLRMGGLKDRNLVIGRTDFDLLPSNLADAIRRNDAHAMTHGRYEIEEVVPVAWDKKKLHAFMTTKAPLYDQQRIVQGVIGISVDITERKRIQDEQLYRILDIIPASIYWKNVEGQYLGCNQYMLDMLGMKRRESILGKTDYELRWSAHADILRSNDLRAMQEGPVEIEEVGYKRFKKESAHVFLTTKAPLYDRTKKVEGVIGVSIDIDDKKRAETLETEKQIIEKNNEAIKILSSSIAHEIRTPLAVINLCVDALKMNTIYEEKMRSSLKSDMTKQINTIKQSVKEASTIIDMLLVKLRNVMLGKVDKKGFKKNSMAALIRTVFENYPFRENQRDCVHLVLDNDFTFIGEPILTQHVFLNLIKNALFAIQAAGKGEILVQLKTTDPLFNQVIFLDTALGMSKELAGKAFEKFETTNDAQSGAGIGLSFCKLVMESCGGSITLRSQLKKFTEFTLSFPKVI